MPAAAPKPGSAPNFPIQLIDVICHVEEERRASGNIHARSQMRNTETLRLASLDRQVNSIVILPIHIESPTLTAP